MYDGEKFNIVSSLLIDRLDELAVALNLEINSYSTKYTSYCPLHLGADNTTAFNFNCETGRWRCYTHHCENTFKGTIIGLIRGVLSKREGWNNIGDKTISFYKTLVWIENFLDKKLDTITVNEELAEKRKFSRIVEQFNKKTKKQGGITRDIVRKSLVIPAQYFINRGFKKDTLDYFDIGYCGTKRKEMYMRSVVPVYDDDRKFMLGATGRSIFDQCKQCKLFHFGDCPKEHNWAYSKWRHSKGLERDKILYNYWYAKSHIQKTETIILVESPLNVLRLVEAGIKNGVAIFGSYLTEFQKYLVDLSGALNLVLILDNDSAGKNACEVITKMCEKTYRIKCIVPPKNDIADLTIEETKQLVLPVLDSI